MRKKNEIIATFHIDNTIDGYKAFTQFLLDNGYAIAEDDEKGVIEFSIISKELANEIKEEVEKSRAVNA